MHWHLVVRDVMLDSPLYEREGYMPDPFWEMAEAIRPGHPSARISSTVQRSTNYGELKCSCTITVDCPQTQPWIERASQYAFGTALQYVNDGFTYLDKSLPPLEVPPWISKT